MQARAVLLAPYAVPKDDGAPDGIWTENGDTVACTVARVQELLSTSRPYLVQLPRPNARRLDGDILPGDFLQKQAVSSAFHDMDEKEQRRWNSQKH